LRAVRHYCAFSASPAANLPPGRTEQPEAGSREPPVPEIPFLIRLGPAKRSVADRRIVFVPSRDDAGCCGIRIFEKALAGPQVPSVFDRSQRLPVVNGNRQAGSQSYSAAGAAL
jgi:hypothetical protein